MMTNTETHESQTRVQVKGDENRIKRPLWYFQLARASCYLLFFPYAPRSHEGEQNIKMVKTNKNYEW